MTTSPAVRLRDSAPAQQIRFWRGADGLRLAYASHGSGPPLLVVSCWLSHLQYDWSSPVWRHFLQDLGTFSTLYRYDERGFGLSDWTVTDFSLEARVADLERLVDEIGFPQISLLGMSGGAPVAIAYAARHPDRVDRFVLYGAAADWIIPQDALPDDEVAYRALIRAGWAREDPVFRRIFTNQFIPGATEEQMCWFDELQRMSTSTDNALASRAARQQVDVRTELSRIAAPTLIFHAVRERIEFEDARMMAAAIPNACLVPLDSANHIILGDEPAWMTFVEELRAFMADASLNHDAGRLSELTSREREVLRLAAEGRTNTEIAKVLVLSVRTVERHLSNAYVKLGLTGRAARTAAVASLVRNRGA